MTIEELREKARMNKENRLANIIDRYINMKPFKGVDDIPEPPLIDRDDYEKYIIPNLIRCGAIPKDKLIKGVKYLGSCRNAESGIWNGKRFEIKRYKWGMWEDDTVRHFEDDTEYDVFVPIKEV